MVCCESQLLNLHLSNVQYNNTGSRGPAVLDDFTASYGYKFNDTAGYQWPVQSSNAPHKL